ncbi:hypothetical protein O0I10_010333 [Lichtheimia ornata]|uniref:Uncharacterized protein n=1 Tax=Lichtheimia ornata TaxID=688661 RepID=A0AAD7UV26_9FUNG|nr:uncharacterized protein O0I10_010333 [Lichtheimia ornata]KAJ8653997.1 hypothetical protein O0I10_010333 [Lichtheimia ornata]
MRFLAIGIIGAIVSATSVAAQGGPDPCSGKSEQDCIKDPDCQETYKNPQRADGSDFHTSNAPLKWEYGGCHKKFKMRFPGSTTGFPEMENPFKLEELLGKQQQGKQQGQK